MIALAYYLLKVIIISGLLFGYYHLALKDKVFHQWNRFYLLASVVFSLTMPLVSFSILTSGQKESRIINALQVVSGTDELVAGYSPSPTSLITTESILSIGFILVSIAMMGILFMAILRIIGMGRKYGIKRLDDIYFINTHEPGTPFSFFKYIFWNEDIDIHTPNGKRIFEHEMVHVREYHSWDKIFLQFILVMGWINPFFWLIRSEIHMIHEFIADKKSIGEKDSTAFAELILQTTYPKYNHLISNPFFQNAIKRRLTMITKSKNPGMNYLSRISALIIATFILLAFTLKPKLISTPALPDKKITVVIDAGHGGTDNGAMGGDLLEKNLNLQISKMVKEVNKNPNVEILLTRESDRTLQLQERIQLVADKKADLFISIHTSASAEKDHSGQESASGMEVFIANNNPVLAEQNIRLAAILLQNLSTVYKTDGTAKKSEKGIYVLDKNTVPGVILECGYISSSKDRGFMSNSSSQKLIAENILKSIEQYFSASVQVNNELSNLDTLPKEAVPVKKDATSAIKPAKPASPATAPAKVTSAVVVTPASPTAAPTKVTSENVATPVTTPGSPTKTSPAKATSYVNTNVVVESNIKTSISNNVQSNISTTVSSNVNSTVNTTSANHQSATVSSVTNAHAGQSVNISSNQQNAVVNISSTTPGSQVRISTNQGSTGDSSIQLKITGPEPLYIIDGVVTSKSVISNLDPNKIASIDVLKGANATKLYGESGKNGVVKITTK